ncbi:MAG TPA: hypothetical protein VNZ22_06530 [Bacillota bacterium]|nr:hypothetical protein [Bacillota bacterium]
MKKQILAGLLSLATVSAAFGQAAVDTYINNFVYNAPPLDPPQVDARTFVNNNTFLIDLLSFGGRYTTLYTTRNTCNYTNNGLLGSSTGFRFDTYDSSTARNYQAASLYNEVGAVIDCGGTNLTGVFSMLGSGPQLRVWATNIVNRGAIEMGINGLLSLQGKTVDLAGGLLNMEGFETGGAYRYWSGIFDGYWGAGQNTDWVPGAYTPAHWVTNRLYNYMQTAYSLSAAIPYQNQAVLGPSNYLTQVVFLQNTADPTFSNSVYFSFNNNIYVEWAWTWTNILTGQLQQDYLHFSDGMFEITNLVFHTNGLAPPSTGYRPTWIPTNYFHSLLGFTHSTVGIPAAAATPPGMTPGILGSGRVTNDYAAYMAIFEPFTLIPGEVAHQSYTNMGGGIEITADKFLDLTSSRIGALNYLRLSAPNHYASDNTTRILTEVADFDLGTTNGLLTVTNLMAPTCPRVNGAVYLYSARWTNVNNLNITNVFHVLMVDSQIKSSSPTLLQNLTLHSTNVFITDVLNVVSNVTVDAENLTIATNGPGALAPAGQLNLLSGNILWTNSFPRLQNLTNYGGLLVSNAAFFGGMRTPPYYPATDVVPYWNFVNYGYTMNQGCFVWATNFENYGILDAGPGSITVQASTAALSNGIANAALADISLTADQLRINHQVLNAGRKLVLWATNVLDDGGATSSNSFAAGVGGFSLPNRPATARLLGTTLTETAPAWARVNCQWSGEDRGAIASGYDNNAALGRLVLSCGQNGQVLLQGASGNNALYVDCLELRDYATNRDSGGNLLGLQLGSGMKLYYADVRVNGLSMAEKLNHKNGGALNWVPAYAGAFSSTNLVYPDGSTNLLNLPLALSCNLDSDNDGTPNCMDPSPCLVPSMVRVTAETTQTNPKATRLTWEAIGFSTNYLFYKTSTASTNWMLLTNFVCGPFNGQASVLDPVASTNRYYRVRVDVPQP